MSTIVRSKAARRAGEALTARGVRVRNACLRQAAVQLGLQVPDDDALGALPNDVSFTDAVRRWQVGDVVEPAVVRVSLFLRAVCAAAVALLGLVLSFGTAQ